MGRRRSRLSLAAVPGLSSLPPISAAQAAEVTSSIRVPLQTLAYSTGPQPPVYKYGIDASLGGATTPQLFVFDTGGEGFQAAHHPSAVWWGSNVSDTGTSFNEPFISQERDIGKVVQTGCWLLAVGLPGQGSAPLFSSSTSDDKVGHANPIELRVTKVGPDASGSPPVQTTFYGDFGLTLKHGSEGIDNLFAQLTDGGNAKPVDFVSLGPYGSMGGSSLQLGLSEADLSNPATTWFAMQGADASNTFARSHLPSFSAELLLSNLNFSGLANPPFSLSPLGVNLDIDTPRPDVARQPRPRWRCPGCLQRTGCQQRSRGVVAGGVCESVRQRFQLTTADQGQRVGLSPRAQAATDAAQPRK